MKRTLLLMVCALGCSSSTFSVVYQSELNEVVLNNRLQQLQNQYSLTQQYKPFDDAFIFNLMTLLLDVMTMANAGAQHDSTWMMGHTPQAQWTNAYLRNPQVKKAAESILKDMQHVTERWIREVLDHNKLWYANAPYNQYFKQQAQHRAQNLRKILHMR